MVKMIYQQSKRVVLVIANRQSLIFFATLLLPFILCENGNTTPKSKLTTLPFNQNLIPKKMTFKGKITSGMRWVDKKGENYTLFSEISKGEDWYLYVNHYRIEQSGLKLIRLLQDKKKCNGLDNVGGLNPASIKLTDLDNNAIGEVTFVYTLGCGDSMGVSAKLMLLENGEKYAIRGTPRLDDQRMNWKKESKNKADSSFSQTSSEFLPFAQKIWNQHTPVIIKADRETSSAKSASLVTGRGTLAQTVSHSGNCESGDCWGRSARFYQTKNGFCYRYPNLTVLYDSEHSLIWQKNYPSCPNKGEIAPDITVSATWQGYVGDHLIFLHIGDSDYGELIIYSLESRKQSFSYHVGHDYPTFDGDSTLNFTVELAHLPFGC